MACCVTDCKNRTDKRSAVKFYRLPKDPQLRALWVKAARRWDLLHVAPGTRRICSTHFITGKYSQDPLHPDYVPSIFNFNKYRVNRRISGKVQRFMRRERRSSSDQVTPLDESPHEHLQDVADVEPILKRSDVARMRLVEQVYGLEDGDIVPFVYNPPERSSDSEEVSRQYWVVEQSASECSEEPEVVQIDLDAQAEVDPVRDHDYCLQPNSAMVHPQPESTTENNANRSPSPNSDGSLGLKKNKENRLLCSICGVFFVSLKSFLTHFKRHSDDRYRCQTCHKKFNHLSHLKTHRRIHTGERPYSCLHCDRTFRQINALNAHQSIHKRRFQCSLCPKTFNRESRLEIHTNRHHRQRKAKKKQKERTEDGSAAPLSEQDDVHTGSQTEDGSTETSSNPETLDSSTMAVFTHADNGQLVFTGLMLIPLKNQEPEPKTRSAIKKTSHKKQKCLTSHTKKQMVEQPQKCSVCSKIFENKYSLIRHMQIHTEEKRFGCSLCGTKFRLKGTLQAHLAAKHTGKTFVCSDCGRKFTTRAKLNFHAKTHAVKKPYGCSVCLQTFESLEIAEEHLEIHKKEIESRELLGESAGHFDISIKYLQAQYLCSDCGKVFETKNKLDSHMKVHCDDRPFSCSICGLKYKCKAALTSHTMIHTGEKPFSCSVCLKGFRNKVCMEVHMRVHTGDRPFQCDVCDAKFSQKYLLKNHNLVHTGERPYSCPKCPKKYKSMQALNHHARTIHGSFGNHQCSICQSSFISEKSLFIHMGKKHMTPQSPEDFAEVDQDETRSTAENTPALTDEENKD